MRRPASPTLAPETLILLASLAFTVLYNGAFWRLLGTGRDFSQPGNWLLFAGLFVAVTGLQGAVLMLLPRRLLKPGLALLFLATAGASFYMDRYGVMFNKDMTDNLLQTDLAESRELLNLPLALHLALYAGLPLLLLTRVRVAARPWPRAAAVRVGSVIAVLALAVAVILPQYRDVSGMLRHQREARFLLAPSNWLVSLFRSVRAANAAPPGARVAIGDDARRTMAVGGRPRLLVLVIGETARSANFGLSGYARDTTPEMRALDPLVWPRVQACGTSTAVSVPCLFAPVGRRDYDEARIRGQESLLHLLARVGVNVAWIDNQSGCKDVCTGLPTVHIPGDADPALCDGEHCRDEILLPRLADAVATASGDLVVVLHLLGNHGPAYSRRYPAAFRRFTPTCESLELTACSDAEIVNAYDNAILYTDHVLAETVKFLKGQSARWDTGLIYVSDHGESLGENSMYLHGMPWRIAPAGQREVPMLMWLSGGLLARQGIDLACVQATTGAPVAHDHLFHTVLGLFNVSTAIKAPSLDLLAGCQGPAGRGALPGTMAALLPTG